MSRFRPLGQKRLQQALAREPFGIPGAHITRQGWCGTRNHHWEAEIEKSEDADQDASSIAAHEYSLYWIGYILASWSTEGNCWVCPNHGTDEVLQSARNWAIATLGGHPCEDDEHFDAFLAGGFAAFTAYRLGIHHERTKDD